TTSADCPGRTLTKHGYRGRIRRTQTRSNAAMDSSDASLPGDPHARSCDPASNKRKPAHRHASAMPLHGPRPRLRSLRYAPEDFPVRILQKRRTTLNRPTPGSAAKADTFLQSGGDLRE